MGFLERLKFWDPEALAKSTLEVTVESMALAKRRHGEKDLHYWLAAALKSRPGYSSVDWASAFHRTMLFSVLDEQRAAAVLGLYIFGAEQPHLDHQARSIRSSAMEPVFALIAEGRFVSSWESLNPWSAANVEGLHELVIATSAELKLNYS